MKKEHVDFWQKTFKSSEAYMLPKHKIWRRLIKQYRLEYDLKGLKKSRIPKISRFYPLTRMIITSTMFNTPKILVKVEDNTVAMNSDVVERIGNQALELMNVKREVQQAGFDSLYCYMGWLKYGVNPPGDEDIVPPYVANDSFQNGMVYAQRVSPFNMFPDPLCAPHNLSTARFIWEKMTVPLEFVKQDKRFDQRLIGQLKPLSDEQADAEMLAEAQERTFESQDEETAWRDSRMEGDYVVLREVHDRVHKKLYTFADGIENGQPIEDRPHPFLAGISEEAPDPVTGEPKLTGTFTPTGGFLVDGGFPYGTLAFDLSHDELYGLPMMAYAEDTQKGIVESLARRRGLLKRGTRIILGNKAERQENINLGEELEEGRDMALAWVNDVHNSFYELQQGNPPPDQLGYESDLRNYEEQTLSVSQLQAGYGPRRTATEASLMASFGQLNREWMQSKVADLYEQIFINTMRLMSDKRFTPENFLVNTAIDDTTPTFDIVRADMLQVRFKVHVEASSMKPMFEELEKEDGLALFNYLIQMPEVPRPEALKHLLRTFRVPNPEKFIGQAARFDAQRAAGTENNLLIMTAMAGVPAPVQPHPRDDHTAHMPVHNQLQQSPGFQQLQPVQQQQVMALMQQHLQGHQQLMQQAAQAGGAVGSPGNVNTVGEAGRSTGNAAQDTIGRVDSAVRSGAQSISQAVSAADRGQN